MYDFKKLIIVVAASPITFPFRMNLYIDAKAPGTSLNRPIMLTQDHKKLKLAVIDGSGGHDCSKHEKRYKCKIV